MLYKQKKTLISEEFKVAFAYGATAFSISAINNVWVTYNYPFFLERMGSGPAFIVVQLIFAVWNAVNDPILGWISDITYQKGSNRRIPHILRSSWLLPLSFVFAWFPWDQGEESAVSFLAVTHFLASLCLYDGALTYVEVNYGSLLSDISDTNKDLRAKCNAAASFCSILGASSSFFAHVLWKEGTNMPTFRIFCLALALSSISGFQVTGRFFKSWARGTVLRSEPVSHVENLHLRKFCSQLATHVNFRLFCALRLLQVFLCTFEKNHLCYFLHFFAEEYLSLSSMGVLISASFVLPHLAIIALTPLLQSQGVHVIVHKLLNIKLLLPIMVLLLAWTQGPGGLQVGDPGWLAVVAYLVSARVVTECICRVFPLAATQLVDEDQFLHHRSHSMAASIIGTTGTS